MANAALVNPHNTRHAVRAGDERFAQEIRSKCVVDLKGDFSRLRQVRMQGFSLLPAYHAHGRASCEMISRRYWLGSLYTVPSFQSVMHRRHLPDLSHTTCVGLRTNGFSSPVWMVTLLSVARMMRNSNLSTSPFSRFQREQVNTSPTWNGCASAGFSSARTTLLISA